MSVNATFVMHESSGIDYTAPRQLAIELAKTRPTILVERPTPWWPPSNASLSSRSRHASATLTCLNPYELPRRWQLARVTDRLNATRWRNDILRLQRDNGPRYVVFDRPGQHRRVGLLDERRAGYYAHCDYTVDIIGRRDAKAEATEREMLRVVDVAFAASPILVERFSRYANKVVHLPCAYNADLFDGRRAYETPSALADVTGPRVMFCGYISGRIDFVGLLQTIEAKPDWSFVFLGAVSAGIRQELTGSGREADLWDRVLACKNVHHLGQSPLAMVPPVMAACDVGLVPYCLSDFTMTSSPQKTFEYLAMGKPVVATAVPETAAVTDDIVFTEQGSSYGAAIETALARASVPDLVEKRLAAAVKNSNAARVSTLLAAMNDEQSCGDNQCR